MKKLHIIILLMSITAIWAQYEDYIIFNDSPTDVSYDPSWGYVNAPSILERIGEKFPVESETVFFGNNSLRLHWTSNSDGDWGFAVAALGWPGHDITQRDTLSFWVYSDTLFPAGQLPLVYLEDTGNRKTGKVSLNSYSDDIGDSTWTRIKVPLRIFDSIAQDAQLTSIKTVFYGQDSADAIDHILLIDEIRMYIGNQSDTIAPAVPTGLIAKAYDSHVELTWDANTEIDLQGYDIYRSTNGISFSKVGHATKEITLYNDFLGGPDQSATYKITAVDDNYNTSDYSSEVSATTYAMTDDELLTMVQEATFRYFWDFAHPVSGLARERTPGNENIVTSGGTGFGVMALLVGIEREFITRTEGAEHLVKMLGFLAGADRFHGAWSHWMNGTTGEMIPFSQYDDGGDLVETAFLIQGLLAARQYFDQPNTTEEKIDSLITVLWESVEWDWYRRTSTSNYLYWHWSPNYNWTMNFPLSGPNETMITYLLATASPTYHIPASLYEDGWASSNNYDNGGTFYGIPLDVGWDYGGPLFFAHYSFLGFDPRYKKDSHTNYFINNRNHTLINRAWCIDNPGGYVGYSDVCWGLTASDDPFGYLAHEPTMDRDNGTITPTAALSSFPYTPDESMAALKHFYHDHGDDLWGPYGFYDAFNLTHEWTARSYIAIDQGPIIVMIENYRSGLLWDLFMANTEIQPMLDAIGFVVDSTSVDIDQTPSVVFDFSVHENYPNPFNPTTTFSFELPASSPVEITIYNIRGEMIEHIHYFGNHAGQHFVPWDGRNSEQKMVVSGIYLYQIKSDFGIATGKMTLLK